MKLRLQFSLLVAIFCIIIVLAGVSVSITSQKVGRITEQEHLANSIVTGAYELSYLSTDYLIHPGEDRQGLQWESRYNSLSDDISRLEVNTPEEEALVRRIRGNLILLHEVFTQSVETIDAARAVPGEQVDTGLVQVIWSRVIVQNQGMIFDASQLSRLLHDEGEQWQQVNTLIILVLMGSILVIFLVTYLFISRRILGAISSLQEGIRVIGSGNLDYVIEKRGDDEIDNLADDFNAMASSLKQVTASKQELEEEINRRKAFELAQKESEIRFSELFDTVSSGVAIYEVKNDGRSGSDYIIRDFNRSALESEGRIKEEVIGKSLRDLRPAIDEYGLIPVFREVWKTGVPAYYPVKIYIDENFANYYENRVFRLPGGEIVAIYNDVTGQKRAEDQVRETKEYLENLIRNAGAPIITWNLDFKITEFNHAFELLTGLKRDDVLGQPLNFLFPEETSETSMDMIRWTARGGQWNAVEIPIRGVSGDTRIVLWNSTALKNNEGATIAILAQGQDITDRKTAEEALQKSEQTYRNLVEHISDVLFTLGPDYTFIYISPVVKIFGFTQDEVKGRSLGDFIVGEDAPGVMAAAGEVLSGNDIELEFRIRNFKGNIFYVHVSARPEWKDKKVAGIAGIMKDITSKKDLERLKVEALQKIEENLIQMAALNDQIRNPLAVIMGAADMAGGPTGEAIIRQVREIDSMINELDRKWVESAKVREFLKKYYGVEG
jgi:PAS domain S-box